CKTRGSFWLGVFFSLVSAGGAAAAVDGVAVLLVSSAFVATAASAGGAAGLDLGSVLHGKPMPFMTLTRKCLPNDVFSNRLLSDSLSFILLRRLFLALP